MRADVDARQHDEGDDHPGNDLPAPAQVGNDDARDGRDEHRVTGDEALAVQAHVSANVHTVTDGGAGALPADDLLDHSLEPELRDRDREKRGGETKPAKEAGDDGRDRSDDDHSELLKGPQHRIERAR